jgi:signal transduction histidine kinase
VSGQAGGREVDESQLRDAMPDYLARIADALRESADGVVRTDAAWADVAREHGAMRVQLGFDLEELLGEFVILRRVVLGVLREEGCLADSAVLDEVLDLIESGMLVSARAYTESRDYAQRGQEAEHISFITHELRNPMTTALLAVGKVKKLAGRSAPDIGVAAEIAERNLRRLDELISGVLKAERLGAGMVKAKLEMTPLSDVVEPALGLACEVAASKGLDLQLQLPPGATAYCDPQLTRSAVQNLVDNAVKFTDRGRVSVVVVEHPPELSIHVFDSCGGIPSAELRHIFDPFERGRRHAGKPGTGVGLAIARSAVQAEGGKLEVTSIDGVGCHFWITLPMERATEPNEGPKKAEEAHGDRGHSE